MQRTLHITIETSKAMRDQELLDYAVEAIKFYGHLHLPDHINHSRGEKIERVVARSYDKQSEI